MKRSVVLFVLIFLAMLASAMNIRVLVAKGKIITVEGATSVITPDGTEKVSTELVFTKHSKGVSAFINDKPRIATWVKVKGNRMMFGKKKIKDKRR